MELEQLDKVVLFLPAANALQVEDFAEVVVVAIGDVDEICLHEGLRWGWPDLQGFEESFDFGEAAIYTFHEACRGRSREQR